MFKRIWILTLIICMSISSYALAADDIAVTIETLVKENLKATREENIDGIMSTIHPDSPAYNPTKDQTAPLFESYDLNYEIVSFTYIGEEGTYAVSRTKQKTTKISGPDFRDNVIDMIQVFRKDEGVWKFWNQVILDIEYL